MSKQKKIDAFDMAVERAGLYRAYQKLNDIAEETIGTYLDDMIDEAASEDTRPVCRIRYEQNDEGEWYIFEIRQADEEEFGLDTAFPLTNDMLSYQALTKIRELMRLGYHIYFG